MGLPRANPRVILTGRSDGEPPPQTVSRLRPWVLGASLFIAAILSHASLLRVGKLPGDVSWLRPDFPSENWASRFELQPPVAGPLATKLSQLERWTWPRRTGTPQRWTALGLHGLATILLWRLLTPWNGALIVAGLWAVHPSTSATVGWIANRPILLASLALLAGGVSLQKLIEARASGAPRALLAGWCGALVACLCTSGLIYAPSAVAFALGLGAVFLLWSRPRGGVTLAAALLLLGVSGLALFHDGAVVTVWTRLAEWGWRIVHHVVGALVPFHGFAAGVGLRGLTAWPWVGAILPPALLIVAACAPMSLVARCLLATLAFLSLQEVLSGATADATWAWSTGGYLAVIPVLAGCVALVRSGGRHSRWLWPAAAIVLAALSVLRGNQMRTEWSFWSQVQSANPHGSEAGLGLGRLDLAEGRPEQAAARFREVLRRHPGSILAFEHMARWYAARGEWDKAIASYRSALSLAPDHPLVWFAMASALEAQGDSSAALRAYDQARLAGAPEALVDNNMGRIREQMGDLGRAGQLYARALEADPNLIAARVNLAGIRFREGNLSAAVALLEEAGRIDPSRTEVYINAAAMIGSVVKAGGLHPEEQRTLLLRAESLLRHAVRLDPHSQPALMNLSAALISSAASGLFSPAQSLQRLDEARWCNDRLAGLGAAAGVVESNLLQIQELTQIHTEGSGNAKSGG
jgi:tetratricopeptide (TPR) repeat protein